MEQFFFSVVSFSITKYNSFTIELVSNVCFNCFPNYSLSSLTIFLPERIHPKGECEVAISEKNAISINSPISFYG